MGRAEARETADPDSILARGQFITDKFDTSKAVDLVLKPGEIALFNASRIHGSGTNISNQRRLMLLVEMMPTCVEERTHRDSATLVRGVDKYRTYDDERRPTEEFGPEELAGVARPRAEAREERVPQQQAAGERGLWRGAGWRGGKRFVTSYS